MRILVKSSDRAKVSKPTASSLQGGVRVGQKENTISQGGSCCFSSRSFHQLTAKELNVLLFCEASEVPPVSREVFKLIGVDGDEHQHGVGHNQPPKQLQQTPPQRVIDLRSERQQLHKTTSNA